MYIDELVLELKEKGITVDVTEKEKLKDLRLRKLRIEKDKNERAKPEETKLINSIKELKSKIRKIDKKLKNKR
ncbi:hypothetical protein H8S20_01610 [Clostridium sp. NSJ-6]|uniref:Uncharacterized protein n=1 Tax=Clostridium hominis TaxID=2763036 RepID=A0ABR7D883_9CLOT|nr:hypothetical protein [Clostridium hominis]MBC5627584.1 hypothetical protein [Clostridium hominis]